MTEQLPLILLVDDEAAIRRIATRVLQRAGYRCIEAMDGQDGFRVWQEQRDSIALVITDVRMPKQSGWELVVAVRGTGSKCPFVVTSGFDASDVVPPGTSEGVLVVGKPWEAAQLIAAVKQMIGQAGPA